MWASSRSRRPSPRATPRTEARAPSGPRHRPSADPSRIQGPPLRSSGGPSFGPAPRTAGPQPRREIPRDLPPSSPGSRMWAWNAPPQAARLIPPRGRARIPPSRGGAPPPQEGREEEGSPASRSWEVLARSLGPRWRSRAGPPSLSGSSGPRPSGVPPSGALAAVSAQSWDDSELRRLRAHSPPDLWLPRRQSPEPPAVARRWNRVRYRLTRPAKRPGLRSSRRSRRGRP